jgi:prepilin-type N-terminal cleavage/methylation domain-containing protein
MVTGTASTREAHLRRKVRHRHCRGVSLTELIVAVALLSTATAGGLSAFSKAAQSRREAGAVQQLHEQVQYVFATLEPEIQMAGYFGASGRPLRLPEDAIPEAAGRCGKDLVARIDLPLQASQAWQLDCEPRGGTVAGTQVLVLRRLSSRLASFPEPGRAQWLNSATRPGQGSLHWQGDAPWTAAGTASGAELRELIVRAWYVSQASDGDPALPALRVKSLTSIAGTPAFIDTEVMPGVEDLQVELLPGEAAPEAVRIRLRVRADGTALPGGAPRTLEVARQIRLRNAAA